MSLLETFRSSVPASLKRKLRRWTSKARLARMVAQYLPEIVCVDVGASYFPHSKWHVMLESPSTHWVTVDPNQQNLRYVENWVYPSQVSIIKTGLSERGGVETLFVTNVDSGSSLLEPRITESMKHRVTSLDYFFPMQQRIIDTLTLADVLSAYPLNLPIFVKLDTQGTELSILKGGQEYLRNKRIVGVELESTMQADPVMMGAGKFWEACQFFESLGYELLDIKPICGPSRFGGSVRAGRTYLNECDAVFALRRDIAAELPVEYRVGLLAFYLCNEFKEEALSLLDEDIVLYEELINRGCDIRCLRDALKSWI